MIIHVLLQFHIRSGASWRQEREQQLVPFALATGATLWGPRRGPPVPSRLPPSFHSHHPLLHSLAASDSPPQWSVTSQSQRCKQSQYVERILTGASKASGPACDSSSLTSSFAASARSDGVRGHPGRRWICGSYF